MNALRFWIFLASLASFLTTAHADVVVVVNPKSPLVSMSPEQVSAIFLGKNMMLPTGSGAVLVDQPENSSLYESFYANVTGKTPSQVKAIWARLTFSGRALPPKTLANSAEVKKFIASHPDAIGYIDKSSLDTSVKAVLKMD
jgi:ABC-type phosphate transport system substrate-binding protein